MLAIKTATKFSGPVLGMFVAVEVLELEDAVVELADPVVWGVEFVAVEPPAIWPGVEGVTTVLLPLSPVAGLVLIGACFGPSSLLILSTPHFMPKKRPKISAPTTKIIKSDINIVCGRLTVSVV